MHMFHNYVKLCSFPLQKDPDDSIRPFSGCVGGGGTKGARKLLTCTARSVCCAGHASLACTAKNVCSL